MKKSEFENFIVPSKSKEQLISEYTEIKASPYSSFLSLLFIITVIYLIKNYYPNSELKSDLTLFSILVFVFLEVGRGMAIVHKKIDKIYHIVKAKE